MLTFRLQDLNAAWKAIHTAEGKLGAKANATATGLLAKARQLATAVPISEKEAGDPSIAGAFRAPKKGEKVAGRQAEFESRWDGLASKNYAEARALAEQALTAK